MRRISFLCIAAILLGLTTFAQEPSLGDVARQTRQKEKNRGAAKKKIITNEEIPESPNLSPGELETVGKLQPASSSDTPGARSAQDWKSTILTQKGRIATLQAQIDKLSASIRFVEANAYYNGVQYNQHQAKKQQQVENMKTQLVEQQKKLEAMQQDAKKAGMGSAVYDP